MNIKYIVSLIVVLVIAIGGYNFPKGNTVVDRVIEKVGAIAGPDIFDALRLGGGVTYGSVNSTTTPAAMTLRVEDVMNYDTVIVRPTGAASTLTLTFFASSTAPHWLPKAGDTQRTCFMNATTTAASTITFAAGTGIDLQTASSSISDLILSADNSACFVFTRKSQVSTITNAYDIEASLTEYNNGD